MKNLDKRQLSELALLLVAIIAWLLRKLNIVYIPGLAGLTLGVALFLVGIGFIRQKDKAKKIGGILIIAFGLLNLIVAVMEVTVLRGM